MGTAEPRLLRERRLTGTDVETESSESGSASEDSPDRKKKKKKKTKKDNNKKKRSGENNCHHETLQISTNDGDTFCDYIPCVDEDSGSGDEDLELETHCPLELTLTILDGGLHTETDAGDCNWCLVEVEE